MGSPLPTIILFELITMTVTVTDPDFNFPEFDWKSIRYKQYVWSATDGDLRDGGLSKSEDIQGKFFFLHFWVSQALLYALSSSVWGSPTV